jgi:esterase/lipase
MQKVIIIPGLGDYVGITRQMVAGWKKKGLLPIIYRANWFNQENLETKLNNLKVFVDKESANNNKVSVIGCSAGGSLALNLFLARGDLINKVISVCGRLKKGDYKGFRSFETRSKNSKAFEESVISLEEEIDNLTHDQLERIMTINPLFGDELVPSDTAIIYGAKNTTIPTIGHTISIHMALSVFSNTLTSFIKDKDDIH